MKSSRNISPGWMGRMMRSLVLGMDISHLMSMVVTDLNVVGISVFEDKADSPLVVDRDRMLPFAVTLQAMQPIAGRLLQVLQTRSQVQILQSAPGSSRQVRLKPFRLSGGVQLLRALVRKRLDHTDIVPRHVTRVNRETGRLPNAWRITCHEAPVSRVAYPCYTDDTTDSGSEHDEPGDEAQARGRVDRRHAAQGHGQPLEA